MEGIGLRQFRQPIIGHKRQECKMNLLDEEVLNMAVNKTTRFAIAGAAAVVVIAGVSYGAYKGKTRDASPSEILAASGNAPAVTANAQPIGAQTKELVPVRTATRKNCTLAPLLVADKGGFLEKEGIKLVFTGELATNQILPSVINGNNDFAEAQPNFLAVARAGGAKVIGVARGQIEPPSDVDPKYRHMRWYVNPKSGIKTIADLQKYKGTAKLKTNGTENTCSTFLLNSLFDKFGVDRSKFEWVVMQTDLQAIQAVDQNILDVAGVHPTFFKAAEDAGLVRIADSTDTGFGETAGVGLYYFSEDYTKKNPETVKKFVKAMQNAQNWANKNPEKTAEWTAEFIGVPVAGNHWYSTTTVIKESDMTPWIEDLVKAGTLKKDQIKPTDLITHEFENPI